ncbi:MAG: hypothetical protein LCH67_12625 [Bacteroidetes bacterium]|nr:hypothetical protein [Bacteroidota bacterium]
MLYRKFKITLAFLLPLCVHAQKKLPFLLTPDTTRFTKVDWTMNLDTRSSYADDKFVNIIGVNTGIAVGKKRSEITLGYYWVNYNTLLRFIDFKKNAAKLVNIDYYDRTNLYYLSLMYFPYLINNYRWKFSIPVEVGVGSQNTTHSSIVNDFEIWKKNNWFVPVQAGLFVEFKASRYLGMSVLTGYRYSAHRYNLSETFNGPYYSYGVSIYSEVMYRDAKKWWRAKKSGND